MIAITVDAATRELAELAAAKLRAQGHRVTLFDNGMAMEAAVRSGDATAVIDLAMSDLFEHPDRLTAAAMTGVPQVIVPVKLTGPPEAMDAFGKGIAEKASAAKGPTRVLLPIDADAVLMQSLRNWIYPSSLLQEVPLNEMPAMIAASITSSLPASTPARG